MSVQTLRARLNHADIGRLVNQGDPESRALAARKFCARYAEDDLSDADRTLGAEVVRILAGDAAELVRRALAVTLQRSVHLPSDVAKRLIEDVESIAVPIIAGSPVLEDEDLIRLASSAPAARQIAVASRQTVSETVVEALVEHAAPDAVRTAASNDGAAFSPRAYAGCFTRFEDNPSVLEGFVDRRSLPLEVTEKLIAHISDTAIQRLVHRHALPAQLAVELAEGARERATVDLVDQAGLSEDPRRFAQQLQMNGRLTPSLILRALFRGHMTFFEYCIAELAEIDHTKAWLLIHDAGPLGLEAVFKRAGLPERVLPAVRAGLQAWHSLEVGPGGAGDIVRFRRRLAERIFTQFQGAPESELNYVLERLDMDDRILAEPEAGAA
ncbi:DUF2336 domain-containing protein [Maricaulaceae bacterium MS644]